MKRAIALLLLQVVLLISACRSEPDIVQVTREVEVTREVYIEVTPEVKKFNEMKLDELEPAGEFCYLPRPRNPSTDYVRLLGNSELFTQSDVGNWTGTFTGTSEDYGMEIHHFTNRDIFIGIASFEDIEIDGKSGGLEMYLMGEKPNLDSDWLGTWVITLGTGELADIQGHGSFWGPGWHYSYSKCGELEYSVDELILEPGR